MIAFDAVSKSYGGQAGTTVLADITLQVNQGEFAAVMGPSGSGKSTLLNLIAGLTRPTSGRIVVSDVEVSTKDEADLAKFRRAHVGFVFQFFHLLNNLRVFDNVLIAAQLAGLPEAVARVRTQQLLNRLGVAAKAREYPAKLSGGEQQRVAIARALVNHPGALLADEPTGALDSHTGEQVMELLADFNRGGQTIVLATHDAGLARRYASRVIGLRDGKLVSDDQLREPQTQIAR